MAKKHKKTAKATAKKKRPGPTPKARKAYHGMILKSYKRLREVLKKHNPEALKS